jgi:adenine-specific DNA-methyltransferase
MPTNNTRRLTLDDLHLCKSAGMVLRLFQKLGYSTEEEVISLSKTQVGFNTADLNAIRSISLLADHSGEMQVLLFELDEIALTRLRSLSANLLSRGGNFLIAATLDYSQLVFINPRREAGKVKIRKLVVDTSQPTRHDLDVLEAIAVTDGTPEVVYQKQCQAFDVERVTNHFYKEYSALFKHTQKTIFENNAGIRAFHDPEKLHTFTQHLLGRIMFLYFIQKKGWLAGDKRFLTSQYHNALIDECNYYNEVLEPLFFNTLNERRSGDQSPWGKIPYLNGGLFERDYELGTILYLPNDLFDTNQDLGILRFFNSFNFTITEDTPAEQEVAVDPEMLGKVFENMMEEQDRGKSGTFYTPRPIVHYMCREALLGYLEEQIGLDRNLLSAQFEEDPEALLTVPQSRQVEKALNSVKVLDPAVGTGAFLVGILHELVALKHACYKARGVDVHRSTGEVAGWKRDFIANCLHGVDIKPEAIDIARLRLWLSLVVDLNLDQVEPLPNLDYKLRVGNSLLETVEGEKILPDIMATGKVDTVKPYQEELGIASVKPQQMGFNLGAADQARSALAILKEKVFTCQDAKERKKLRTEIEAQERAVVVNALDEIITNIDIRIKYIVEKGSVVNWKGMSREQKELEKLYARKGKLVERRTEAAKGLSLPFFLFRLHFLEVFRDKGGFDIVIANPPYVRMELFKQQKADLSVAYEKVYEGRADLYVYFFARGFDVLRNGGMFSIVSSNKYMRSDYGKKLRKYLSEETDLSVLIDFSDLSVFDAISYPAICISSKSSPSNRPIITLKVDDLNKLDHLNDEVKKKSWITNRSYFSEKEWFLENPIKIDLLKKIRNKGTSFGQVCNNKFYMGIKTGFNSAFIISKEIRDQLCSEDLNSLEIIKPFLRGRNVKRWKIDPNNEHVIFTYHGVDISKYPAILNYLIQYKSQLESRATTGLHYWYELQQPQMGIYKKFEHRKIIWPDIADGCQFTLDVNGYFPDMTLFTSPIQDTSLLAILNSNITSWFIKNISSTIQQGYIRFKSIYVNQIPVPTLTSPISKNLASLSQNLLSIRGEGNSALELEKQINDIVYWLFDLTENERSLIEDDLNQ